MKKVNKKVLKVVEHVMRKEAVYGIDGFPVPTVPANAVHMA